jgi:hypothetical protein
MTRRALILLLLLGSPLPAQKARSGLSPEDQKKVEELQASARKSLSVGKFAMQIGFASVSVAIFWAAYSTVKKGFKISESNVITGTGAKVIAAILVLFGIAVAVGGIVYGPSLLPNY